jgi:hypothetical protein
MKHEAVTNHRGVVVLRTTDKKHAKKEVFYQMQQFGSSPQMPKRSTVDEVTNRCGKPMRAQASHENDRG